MRLTEFDKVRNVYVISPDAKQGENIQKLGRLEDRDTACRDEFTEANDDGTNELVYECGNCHAAVGHSYIFCPWCGQRLKEV